MLLKTKDIQRRSVHILCLQQITNDMNDGKRTNDMHKALMEKAHVKAIWRVAGNHHRLEYKRKMYTFQHIVNFIISTIL